MSRRNNRNTPVVGVTPHDVVIGYDEYGCPVVGSFWDYVNPVNVAKTVWNASTMPFRVAYQAGKTITQPVFNETQRLRSLFGGGSSAPPSQPPGMPPGMSYMPPGQYQPQPWGAAPPPPPQYAPPQYAPPQYAPPQYAPQYAPQYPQQPTYDPAAYGAAFADFGSQPTGWDAAYGSGN